MTLDRADARFVLPQRPESAALLGELAGWRDALVAAGIDVVAPSENPDVVVGPTGLAGAAVEGHPPSVLIEGRVPLRHLRDSDYRRKPLLALPTVERPSLLAPLDQASGLRHALEVLARPQARSKQVRNRVLRGIAARGFSPPGLPTVTLATPAVSSAGPPYLIREASALGIPDDVAWTLVLGERSRSVFYLFRREETAASWVLKFSRVPGEFRTQFELDERGLRLVHETGGPVAAVAPDLVGRFETGGVHASVETAAVGPSLFDHLAGRGSRSDRMAAIDRLAGWILDVATSTRAEPSALAGERHLLASEVLTRWTHRGAPTDLVDRTDRVPAVFLHGDVFSWNVVWAPNRFWVLDWPMARSHGYPLWDLCFFLSDSLAVLDGVGGGEEREDYLVRLWRGEEASSSVALAWVRRMVDAVGIPPSAVGAVVTLLWLTFGAPDEERHRAAGKPRGWERPFERIATRWMAAPGLGADWDLWQG